MAMGNISRGVFKEGLSEEVMFELRLNYEKAPTRTNCSVRDSSTV